MINRLISMTVSDYTFKRNISATFSLLSHLTGFPRTKLSFILFSKLKRFLGKIETDNLTVSNSEFITFDFTVSKYRIFVK